MRIGVAITTLGREPEAGSPLERVWLQWAPPHRIVLAARSPGDLPQQILRAKGAPTSRSCSHPPIASHRCCTIFNQQCNP
jgi:hypothetical protein